MIPPNFWIRIAESFELFIIGNTSAAAFDDLLPILVNIYQFLLTNNNNSAYIPDLFGCFAFAIIRNNIEQPHAFCDVAVPFLVQQSGSGLFPVFLDLWIENVGHLVVFVNVCYATFYHFLTLSLMGWLNRDSK